MYLENVLMLLGSTVLTGGGGGEAAPVAEAAAETASGSLAGGLFGNNFMMVIVVYAAVLGAMWFFMARPQKKREKAMREMQASLAVGDDVITSSGFYGRIVSVGDDCFVVEFGTGKGVRVPVRKADIIGKKAPSLMPGASE